MQSFITFSVIAVLQEIHSHLYAIAICKSTKCIENSRVFGRLSRELNTAYAYSIQSALAVLHILHFESHCAVNLSVLVFDFSMHSANVN